MRVSSCLPTCGTRHVDRRQRRRPSGLSQRTSTRAHYRRENTMADGQDRYAAVFEQREGPRFEARHGLSSAQYQQVFDQLVPQGFRPVVVSGYSVGGQDRYAAVFEQREGPQFEARHGLSSAQYQQVFDQLVPQGFRPVVVSGYSI